MRYILNRYAVIMIISFAVLIVALNGIYPSQNTVRIECNVIPGREYTSQPLEHDVEFNFPEKCKWKFEHGGYLLLKENNVLLPISNIVSVKEGDVYTWVPTEVPIKIWTNDLHFCDIMKEKNVVDE